MRVSVGVALFALSALPLQAQTLTSQYTVTSGNGKPIEVRVSSALAWPAVGASFEASRISVNADSLVLTLPARMTFSVSDVDVVLRTLNPTDTLMVAFARLDQTGTQTIRAGGSQIRFVRRAGMREPEIQADWVDFTRP